MPNRETKVLTECSTAPLADLNAKSARLLQRAPAQQRSQEQNRGAEVDDEDPVFADQLLQ